MSRRQAFIRSALSGAWALIWALVNLKDALLLVAGLP